MNRLSKHDVNKLTAQELKAKLPFEIVSDNEVIAAVIPAHDVNKLKRKSEDTGELRFSKQRQAREGL